GSSIHISDFVCESIGHLKLSDYEISINDLLPDSMHLKYTKAGIAIYPGINCNGWWICDDLVNQVVEYAIPIFEQTHPNKIALFMFDNSSNYGSFAEDTLLVLQMGMKDGTKKLLLRDDTMPDGSKHIMIYIDNANVERPKGIKQVLEEKAQSDFAAQRSCILNNFACCSEQFINAYELGLSGKAADFAVKKYCSYHRISEQVLEEFAYD
ncbi:32521_t:CDS:2, partial [Racocetra persica]